MKTFSDFFLGQILSLRWVLLGPGKKSRMQTKLSSIFDTCVILPYTLTCEWTNSRLSRDSLLRFPWCLMCIERHFKTFRMSRHTPGGRQLRVTSGFKTPPFQCKCCALCWGETGCNFCHSGRIWTVFLLKRVFSGSLACRVQKKLAKLGFRYGFRQMRDFRLYLYTRIYKRGFIDSSISLTLAVYWRVL